MLFVFITIYNIYDIYKIIILYRERYPPKSSSGTASKFYFFVCIATAVQ